MTTGKDNTALGQTGIKLGDAEIRLLIKHHAGILEQWVTNNFTAKRDDIFWRVDRMRELTSLLED